MQDTTRFNWDAILERAWNDAVNSMEWRQCSTFFFLSKARCAICRNDPWTDATERKKRKVKAKLEARTRANASGTERGVSGYTKKITTSCSSPFTSNGIRKPRTWCTIATFIFVFYFRSFITRHNMREDGC